MVEKLDCASCINNDTCDEQAHIHIGNCWKPKKEGGEKCKECVEYYRQGQSDQKCYICEDYSWFKPKTEPQEKSPKGEEIRKEICIICKYNKKHIRNGCSGKPYLEGQECGWVENIKKAISKSEKARLIGEIKERINNMQCPYPESVFIEPTHEQYETFNKYLKEKGLYPDAYNGAMGRRVWKYMIETFKEVMSDIEDLSNG